MSLQDKIKKIIKVIENTNIEEIEISSFWGAQRIKLSKKKSVKNVSVVSEAPILEQKSDDTIIPVNDSKNNNLQEDNQNSDANIQKETEPSKDVTVDVPVVAEEDLEYQIAPLVGTFYASSKPGEPPFVNVGDKVSKGQTVCIIEAMKIFNEIESDFDGIVVEVLVEDSSPVEFNQAILSIKPSE